MGVPAMWILKDLGPRNPAEKLAYFGALLGQLSDCYLKIFRPDPQKWEAAQRSEMSVE